jgi:hypothetical protein
MTLLVRFAAQRTGCVPLQLDAAEAGCKVLLLVEFSLGTGEGFITVARGEVGEAVLVVMDYIRLVI